VEKKEKMEVQEHLGTFLWIDLSWGFRIALKKLSTYLLINYMVQRWKEAHYSVPLSVFYKLFKVYRKLHKSSKGPKNYPTLSGSVNITIYITDVFLDKSLLENPFLTEPLHYH
jgi:hypothetical protein